MLFLEPGPLPGLPGPAVGSKGPKIGQNPKAGFIILSSQKSAQSKWLLAAVARARCDKIHACADDARRQWGPSMEASRPKRGQQADPDPH